jgi:sugar lactone lactonase YvrE
MAVRTELGAGSRLASYTIVSVLGRGAMSVVYEAEDARLGRRVALKVLAPSMGERAGFRERFLRESRIAASIDHPNVIPIYEAGEEDGLVYIAMRLVAGTDLRALLARERTLSPPRALRIVGQAASAVDAAHAAGLLHRDIKPGNILLAFDGDAEPHVYLSDFGLAVSGDAEGVLDGGGFHGTAEYAAPEQIEGKPEARSDVYSLACVLYECLAGQPPFGRRRLLATLYAHLHEDAPPLTDHYPRCPAQAATVLAAALAKAPEERPATCGELVARTRAAFGLERKTWSTRRRALAVGTLAAATAVVVALAVGLRSGSEGSTAQVPTISTFAGTGRPGFGGDGGPATGAELSEPGAITVDDGGNVYVAEWGPGGRVRRIGRDGVIRTVDGITAVSDLAVGPTGDVYLARWGEPAIWRIDGRRVLTHVVGSGKIGLLSDGVRTVSPDLCRVGGLAVDPAGALYVSCLTANRVIRVERDGAYTTVAGSGEAGYDGDGRPAREAALHRPQGIAFDGAGNLYIADELNHRVRKVDTRGIITTYAGTGERGVSGDGFRASFVDLWSPLDVAVDHRGNVYVLEGSLSRVRKIGRDGIITTVAGTGKPGFSGDGGPAGHAELRFPVTFALDRDGNVFIADRSNHRVRKVTVPD